MLTLRQINDVCLVSGGSKQCRYLGSDDNHWHCLKKSARRAEIDAEFDEFLQEARARGRDPYKMPAPMGDNCQGYPVLQHTMQGYDVP